MGMDTMGGMGEEKLNPLMQFYMSLPEWGQALGRLYASVRYPDPEKNSAISPKLRVLFLAVLLVCGFWLYRSMTKKDEPAEPVDGTGISEGVPSDEYAPEAGGAYANVGGAVAAAVPG